MPLVLFGDHTGIVKYIDFEFHRGADGTQLYKTDERYILLKYFYFLLKSKTLFNASKYKRHSKFLKQLKIPLPPIEKQKEIVTLMEEEENIILEQEKITKELNNKIISFDFSKYDNKSIKLNEIISLEYGVSLPEKKRILGEYPVYGSNGIVGYHNKFLVEAPNIIIGRKGSAGEINFANKNFTPIDTTFYVKPLVILEMKYLFYLLKNLNLPQYRSGLGSGGINRQFILNLDINYIDAIEQQKEIVSKLEKYEQEIEQAQLKINNAKINQKEIMDDIFQID